MSLSSVSLRRLSISVGATILLGATASCAFEKQPDRYNNVIGAKHTPILNPGGSNYAPPTDQSAIPAGAAPQNDLMAMNSPDKMPPPMSAPAPVPMPQTLPAGVDMTPPTGDAAAAPLPAAVAPPPMAAAPAPMALPAGAPMTAPNGRHIPAGNEQVLGDQGGLVTQGTPAPMADVAAQPQPAMASAIPTPQNAPMPAAPMQPVSVPAAPMSVQPAPADAAPQAMAMNQPNAAQPATPVVDSSGDYQPMTDAQGNYPTLSEVPPKPSAPDIAAMKKDAANFNAQSVKEDQQAGMNTPPAQPVPTQTPAAAAPTGLPAVSTPIPGEQNADAAIPPAPTYENEMKANDPMLAAAKQQNQADINAVANGSPTDANPQAVPQTAATEPMTAAPTPMQQAGQSYYNDGNVAAPAPSPAIDTANTAVSAPPAVSGEEPTPMDNGNAATELAPIHLHAPMNQATAGAAAGGTDVAVSSNGYQLMADSRYAARIRPDAPGTQRH